MKQLTITDYAPTIVDVMPINYKSDVAKALQQLEAAKDKMKEANGLLFAMAGNPNAQDCAKANKLITEAMMLI